MEQKGQIIPNSDEGLLTEEREAKYKRGLAESMVRRARWVEDFQSRGKDASTLPRAPKLATYQRGQPSLTAALEYADLVVEGRVAKVVYTPTGAVGTLRIATAHKASDAAVACLGSARATEAQVGLGYSPEPPDRNSPEGVLAFDENQPLLLPGARALLFLQVGQVRDASVFVIQSYTGGYAIDANGQIAPVDGNPFAALVRGLTPEQFTALVIEELSGHDSELAQRSPDAGTLRNGQA